MMIARLCVAFFLVMTAHNIIAADHNAIPIKSVLIPFLANPKYLSKNKLNTKKISALLEKKIVRKNLIPQDILASQHLTFISSNGSCLIANPENMAKHDMVAVIKSAIFADIINQRKNTLLLEKFAHEKACSELYDFIKLWVLNKNKIEIEYNIYKTRLSQSSQNTPLITLLKSFLPNKDNTLFTNTADHHTLNIENTKSHADLINCLEINADWIIFSQAIENIISDISFLFYNAAVGEYLNLIFTPKEKKKKITKS